MALSPNETISWITNSFSICSKPQVAKVTGSGAHARGLLCSSTCFCTAFQPGLWLLTAGRLGRPFAILCIWMAEVSRGHLSTKQWPASKPLKARGQKREMALLGHSRAVIQGPLKERWQLQTLPCTSRRWSSSVDKPQNSMDSRWKLLYRAELEQANRWHWPPSAGRVSLCPRIVHAGDGGASIRFVIDKTSWNGWEGGLHYL